METLEDPSGVPIEQLSLTIRWYHTLKRNGIHTVGQLAALPEPRLKAMELPPRAAAVPPPRGEPTTTACPAARIPAPGRRPGSPPGPGRPRGTVPAGLPCP